MELFHFWNRSQEEENARIQKSLDLAQKEGFKIVWVGENFVSEDRPYADHKAFDGIYVDEPLSIGDLEKLTNELEVFQEKYPAKNFYVNFAVMFGRSWDIYAGYFKDTFLKKATTRTVSGDTYPLREPDEKGRTMTPFLDYIRRVGKTAIESDSEMYFFVCKIIHHCTGAHKHCRQRRGQR